MASTSQAASPEALAPVSLPRVTIQFCTQCKWNLRAAYFAQELLSTFSASLGEVSLIPSTGGVFTVDIVYAGPHPKIDFQSASNTVVRQNLTIHTARLWDRKTEGAFPETKELKKLVRDVIDPDRDLGHVDGKRKPQQQQDSQPVTEIDAGTDIVGNHGQRRGAERHATRETDGSVCEDCI
ncbi:hypothetical protein MMC12_005482 [Toensbergia leucococca]|nr:hypothetical protein [Toensbergia leucococca]